MSPAHSPMVKPLGRHVQ